MSAEQSERLTAGLQALMAEWKAHGTPVPGRARIVHQRFVLVEAAPGSTSGCSIDSMTKGVEALLAQEGLRLLENGMVSFMDAAGDIRAIHFTKVPEALADGTLGPDTTIFDVTLGMANDLSRFEVSLADSWLSRYLAKA